MMTFLQKRFQRAAGMFGAAKLVPPNLTEMAETLKRVLPDSLTNGALAKGGAMPASALPRAPDFLGKLPDLGVMQPWLTPKAKSAIPMLARHWRGEPGARPYKLFVPSAHAASPALVVMLHGCTQTPEDFAAGTRMNILAEESGVLVLYPEQISNANPQRCWNWFNPADQARGAGEPAIIAGMVQEVIAEFGVDRRRVFAAGLSAGGANAAVLGMTYPDIFRAIGIHSGLACGAAHDLTSALAAMRQGGAGQGHLRVPAIVFHGDKDSTVNPANAGFIAAQSNDGPTLRTEDGQVPDGLSFTRIIRARPAFEQWIVHGLGHAWSGGSSDGSYTDPRGPDASKEMLRFFMTTQ